MRRWRGFVGSGLLLAAIATAPAAAVACSCMQPTPEQGFARATAVFAGRVVAIDKPFFAWLGLTETGGYDVTLRVTRRWKGAAGARVTVRTRLTGEACGYPFRVGEDYLVYVAPGYAEDLQTGTCSGTRDLAGAAADMQALDGLTDAAE